MPTRLEAKITHLPEIEDLINVEGEAQYAKIPKDHVRKPGRHMIMNDAVRALIVKRYLDAAENNETITQRQVGEEFGIVQQQVSNSLKTTRQLWRDSEIRDWNEYVQIQLDTLNLLEEEAFQAWQKSKQDAESLTIEEDEHGDIKTKVTTKGKDPNAKYLDVIIKCIAKRSELLGLDAPTKVEIDTPESKLLEYMKSGRVTLEQVQKVIGPSMAQLFLKRANISE